MAKEPEVISLVFTNRIIKISFGPTIQKYSYCNIIAEGFRFIYLAFRFS